MIRFEIAWGTEAGDGRLPAWGQAPALPPEGTVILLKEVREREHPWVANDIEFEVEVQRLTLNLEDPDDPTYTVEVVPLL